MGVIMGIIWFVTGMHWAFALGYLIMAIVADFVAGAGQYKSKKTQQPVLISCSLSAALVRISCSLLTPTAGHRLCWETELNRATSTPCRQLQIPAS